MDESTWDQAVFWFKRIVYVVMRGFQAFMKLSDNKDLPGISIAIHFYNALVIFFVQF